MSDSVTADKLRETQRQSSSVRKGTDHALVKPEDIKLDKQSDQPVSQQHALIQTRRDEAMASAREYANRSRSNATWRAYENDWTQFCDWCESVDLPALPSTSETVAGFISVQADNGRAISTIRRRLAAIRLMHIASDHPSPHDTLQVNEVLRGIANAQRNRPARKAKPAIDDVIKQLVDAIDTNTLRGLRDRALLLMGFDSAMRRSELVSVHYEHIERQKVGLLITIPHSKTDQTGKGSKVAILERPDSPYCPVKALDAWLTRASIKSGPIFRRLYKGNNETTGDKPLTDRSVSLIIKARAKQSGFDPKDIDHFSGHSLRRGFITSAASAGQGLLPIMKQSRHKKSDSLIGYVESVDLLTEHPGKILLSK